MTGDEPIGEWPTLFGTPSVPEITGPICECGCPKGKHIHGATVVADAQINNFCRSRGCFCHVYRPRDES